MANERRLWFRAKRYGWGWCPATWEGWAVVVGYAAALAGAAFLFDVLYAADYFFPYFVTVVVLTIALVAVSWLTGEPPRWRWGKDPEPPISPPDASDTSGS